MFQERMKSIKTLSDAGLIDKVEYIVDVGANRGDWSRMIRSIFPEAQIFMIEAQQKLSPFLNETGNPFYISLVGDKPKDVKFTRHSRFDTAGTIFDEASFDLVAKKELIVKETLHMDTIDNILSNNFPHPIDLMKFDIQGAELLALFGAPKTLQKTKLVCLELGLHQVRISDRKNVRWYDSLLSQYNKGACSFADVNAAMEINGFQVQLNQVHFFAYWFLYLVSFPSSCMTLLTFDTACPIASS